VSQELAPSRQSVPSASSAASATLSTLHEGILDDSFGDHGVSTGNPDGLLLDLFRTRDGKLLVVTETGVVYRYNAGGSLDTTFGNDGTGASGGYYDRTGGTEGGPERGDGLTAFDPAAGHLIISERYGYTMALAARPAR
jgi:hypothetical protein